MRGGQHVMRSCFSVPVSRWAAVFCTSRSKTISGELQASSRNCLQVSVRPKEENWKTWKLEWQQANNRIPATSQAERSSFSTFRAQLTKPQWRWRLMGRTSEQKTQMVFQWKLHGWHLLGGRFRKDDQAEVLRWNWNLNNLSKHLCYFGYFYDICFHSDVAAVGSALRGNNTGCTRYLLLIAHLSEREFSLNINCLVACCCFIVWEFFLFCHFLEGNLIWQCSTVYFSLWQCISGSGLKHQFRSRIFAPIS